MNRKNKYNLKSMLQCSLFAALLCIMAPLTFPVGVVPVTLGIFAVIICASVLGVSRSMVSVGVYIALGAIGLPVFSGWQGGVGVLVGPTGGYIWSYIIVCIIVGKCADMSTPRWFAILCGLLALLICYICGTVQYMVVSGSDIVVSLTVCVYPFVIFDIIKVWAATVAGNRIRDALKKNGVADKFT